MERRAPNLIPCGIEPVDELLGGLERGQLYLVHGEAAGKSLFGIRFLIEGLKRGEHGALVIRYSPEDAVRRFARLGYDCLEDVYSGRLVILEYSDDIIQQVSRLRELTPVLRELEWLLGETKPQRLIFDPVTSLVAGAGDMQARVAEFTEWARSFGATVVFIANGDGDIVNAVKPHTADVFRFEVKDIGDRAARYLVFEKSRIPDQAVEVDPSRGIFLLDRARASEHFFSIFQGPPAESPSPAGGEAASPASAAPSKSESAPPPVESSRGDAKNDGNSGAASVPPATMSDVDFDRLLQPFANMANAGDEQIRTEAQRAISIPPATAPDASPRANEPGTSRQQSKPQTTTRLTGPEPLSQRPPESDFRPAPEARTADLDPEFFADIIEELTRAAVPLNLQPTQFETASLSVHDEIAPISGTDREQTATGDAGDMPAPPATESLLKSESAGNETRRRRATDAKIDSAMAARATEVLLRPPANSAPLDDEPIEEVAQQPAVPAAVMPKDCNILVIDDDPVSCELVAQTLAEYTVEVVHDGMSGLAKLISVKPDLVVLSLDLPIIDGFKVLEHIRQGLNVPVILITGTRIRASDRVLAAELGADYYMTKPYSSKELRHKARQLVARYRGLHSWIAPGAPGDVMAAIVAGTGAGTGATPAASPAMGPLTEPVVVAVPTAGDRFTPYQSFTARVEEHVRATLESNATFAIVGCRVPRMTAKSGQLALRLYDLVRRLIRENDLISTNPRNDIVMLLTDANASGARAFVSRLREGIVNQLNQEPNVWLRTFPDLEEATSAKDWTYRVSNGGGNNRRVSDRKKGPMAHSIAQSRASGVPVSRDPRHSYMDFLEQM